MKYILSIIFILAILVNVNSQACELHPLCTEDEVCTLPMGYIQLCWSEMDVAALKYYKLSYGYKSGEYIGSIDISKDQTEYIFNFNKSGDWFLKITTIHNIGATNHHEMERFDELHLIISSNGQLLKDGSIIEVRDFQIIS